MRIILGSASPRRREILSYFSLPFEQKVSGFDEDSIPFTGNPLAYAKNLAENKAKCLAKDHSDALIICADTIVVCEGEIFGKPETEEDCYRMVKKLQGKCHSVFTAITVCLGINVLSDIEETKVYCNHLTDEQIKKYIEAHTLHDKAGGYAIQKSGSLLVKKIEGCYYNVCGLPINLLQKLLFTLKIDLWNYLQDFR